MNTHRLRLAKPFRPKTLAAAVALLLTGGSAWAADYTAGGGTIRPG